MKLLLRRVPALLLVCMLLAGGLGLPAYEAAAQAGALHLALPLVSSAPLLPVLQPIANADGDDSYTVSWLETPRLSPSFELEEASDADFTQDVRSVCSTSDLSCQVTGRAKGEWYYRVRGIQPYYGGYTAWSAVESVRVSCGAIPYNESALWNMALIHAPQAWACPQGGAGVTIAILDTGVYSAHPDLAGNLVAGATFVISTTSWADDHGHGTHVAGIAAGIANNGGIFGAAPRASIMPVKVCNKYGNCEWDDIANGIHYAVDSGARVINLSLGEAASSAVIYDAVRYAYERGVLIAAAAGNDGVNELYYPASYAEVLAVAATSALDTRMYFSNMGDWLDVSAPGDYIYSSYYTGTLYSTMRGTSMAAPHVAGLAALIFALRSGWSPDQVREHIQATADDITRYGVGWDDKTGWGRINAQRAVAALLSEAATAAPARASTPASLPEAPAAPAVPADPAEYAPGEVLYKLRAGAQAAEVLSAYALAAGGIRAEQAVTAAGVWVLRVPAGQERLWLERLRADAQVEFAELNGIMHID